MIWQILLSYLVLSEVVFFYWIWSSVNFCDEIGTRVDVTTMSAWQKFRMYSVINLLMLVAAPFALPVMAFFLAKWYREATKEHEALFRLYKEMNLEPLHPSNMPKELGAYIEEHSPAAIAMNFEELGDYWLKDEPYNSKARIFMSQDKTTFCEIGVTFDILYCETISFLEDGSLLSTANCEPFGKPAPREKLGWYINAIDEADMLQVLEAHAEYVDSVMARTNKSVRTMSKSIWKDYYHYHNHKYGQVRFGLGETDAPPEKCVFPNEGQLDISNELEPVS